MDSNDFDDDVLIAYVEKFEFLWNKNSKGYKDKHTKENGWKNIGKILGSDGDVCRRRFDTLRNRYVTFKRKMNKSSGSLDGQESPSSSATDWSSMNFLDKYIKHRKKSGTPAKKPSVFADKVTPPSDEMVLIVQSDSAENKAQIIKMENNHEDDSENENYISFTTEKSTTRKRRLCQITPQDFYEESSMTDSSIESSKLKPEKMPIVKNSLIQLKPEKNEAPTTSVTEELIKLSKQLTTTTSTLAAESENNQNSSKQSDVVEAFATYLCAQLHQIQCKKKQRRTINQISSYAMQVINEVLSDDE